MSDMHRRRFRLLPRLPITRRMFLRRAGGASVGLLALGASGCGSSAAPGTAGGSPPVATREVEFRHGVASGDPLSDRVILWTRVSPADGEAGPVAVDWQVATTPDLAAPVASGRFLTDAGRDYTVKVDAAGLASYTTYYYGFSVTLADGRVLRSPVGRTRTAPGAGDTVERVRVAVASCNNYAFGFFNAFGRIGERADLDLVIHLGDYLYEGGESMIRAHLPAREILTLADYRERHAQYKTDPDLQAAHRQHPWITTWDDHETTNNSYRTGADNHTEGADAEGFWEERMGWALRAYFEWMPIRDNGPGFDAPGEGQPRSGEARSGLLPDGLGRIYRTVRYGELIDFIILDTRLAGRALQSGTSTVSEQQTILGAEQRAWFLDALAASTATWKIIGTGTTFAPLISPAANPTTGCTGLPGQEPCYLNEDAWDGYRFDRNAVFDAIETNGVQNCAFIFGDIHAVIACDLPRVPNDPLSYNPVTGDGSLGVELCCGGVAQVPLPIWDALRVSGQNPHMKHVNETQLGYLLMDVTPERLQGEWYYAPVLERVPLETADPVILQTASGSQRLALATSRSEPKPDAPALAP